MKILGIESSCDDTSVALLEIKNNKIKILAEKTASQIEIHKKYGGVVPEIAGRMHAEKILPLIEAILDEAKIKKPNVIAVTSGPGLITGLMVGVEAAKNLSYLWNVPIVSVNHIEGHIFSSFIPNPKGEESFEENEQKNTTNRSISQKVNPERFLVVSPRDGLTYPALALIASGGHTELILIKAQGKYKKIGATLDDAAGECFDKVAKILGLEYPGGPKISKYAETGNSKAIKFPRPMLKEDNFDFSFAGLKTSALYWLGNNKLVMLSEVASNATKSKHPEKERDPSTPPPTGGFAQDDVTLSDFCASFEQAIIDVLVGKTLKAAIKYKPKTIILGGGVAANKKLRKTLEKEIKNTIPHSSFLIPEIKYAMDNSTMIALAGYYKAKNKKFTSWKKLIADPNWEIK